MGEEGGPAGLAVEYSMNTAGTLRAHRLAAVAAVAGGFHFGMNRTLHGRLLSQALGRALASTLNSGCNWSARVNSRGWVRRGPLVIPGGLSGPFCGGFLFSRPVPGSVWGTSRD